MKYYMKSKIFKVKEDFWIKNGNNEKAYYIDNKLLAVGLRFDMIKNDQTIYSVRENLLAIICKYEMHEKGKLIAQVNRKLPFIKDKIKVESKYGDLLVKGDIFNYNYKIYKNNKEIATIVKEFFSITDNYYIEIDFEDEAFILAIVVIVDDIIDNHRHIK